MSMYYAVVKVGRDTAENGSRKVWGSSPFQIRNLSFEPLYAGRRDGREEPGQAPRGEPADGALRVPGLRRHRRGERLGKPSEAACAKKGAY